MWIANRSFLRNVIFLRTLASSLKLLHGNEVSLEGDSSKVNVILKSTTLQIYIFISLLALCSAVKH